MLKSDLKRASELSKALSSFGTKPSKAASGRAYLIEAPAPTTDTLSALIEPLVKHHIAATKPPEVEITPELVKKIVQMMHSLPEIDKLEVSKGIRNAASFVYGGTKYGVHEMMHGAGASSATIFVIGEVVAGSGTNWILGATPTANTTRIFVNGQRLKETTDYVQVGAGITTLQSWSAGTMLADYNA